MVISFNLYGQCFSLEIMIVKEHDAGHDRVEHILRSRET